MLVSASFSWRWVLGWLVGVGLWLGLLPLVAQAAEPPPVRIVAQQVENHFPDSLTFQATVSAHVPLVRATLYYRLLNAPSVTRAAVDFTPATQVTLTYTWDTHNITVPPSAPVVYYWELEDEDGHRLRTEAQTVRYDDGRFPWQELADEQIVLRWYEGDQRFGQRLFDIARQALDQMQEQTGYTLELPVYLLIYANDRDFASWHTYVDEWVGGQAFPSLGVTAEIIPPTTSAAWLLQVIPHEVAHLFFYQAVHGALADWPHWLDEGFAQYYEFVSPEAQLALVAQAARNGQLIPLQALSGSFGRDTEQVRLAYAESLSAVVYIHERWGDNGFRALVQAFRQGRSTRQAFREALGVSWEEFIAGWLTWMGVPATPAPSPSPTHGYVFPTAPVWTTPTRAPKPTATASLPAPSPTPSATPALSPEPTQRCLSPVGVLLVPGVGLVGISWTRRRARDASSARR